MTEEPSNEQLANFLVVYARQIPQFRDVHLDAVMLKSYLDLPVFREIALKHHRRFQQQADALNEKMDKGELSCMYIRPNGKNCPNYNQPGTPYCGLHQDVDEGETHGSTG